MRMSRLFNQTLRETPARGQTAGIQLLVRAGYLHPASPVNFINLPLGVRAIQKMQNFLRLSIEQQGAQEILLPMKISVREALLEVISRNVQSYRHLPRHFYTIGVQPHSNLSTYPGIQSQAVCNGLSLFSLAGAPDEMERQSAWHRDFLVNTLHDWELPIRIIPGGAAHGQENEPGEIVYPSEHGILEVLSCPACGYSANRASARFGRGEPSAEDLLPLEDVHTPGAHTIQELADYLHIPAARTAKAVFLVASYPNQDNTTSAKEEFIFAVIRGDLDVDEGKLVRLLGLEGLRPATDMEIRAVGAEPGYASPLGLKNVRIVVDESIVQSRNLVAGANRPEYHLRNVNYGRDFSAWKTADIALARQGYPCPCCAVPLSSQNAVLLGTFKRWTSITSGNQSLTFLDSSGKAQPICLSACWLDIDSVLACIAQEHHDEKGLQMPGYIAPYSVYLVVINSKDGSSEQAAEKIYHDLTAAQIDTLLDDRQERAGVKFNDADLIGSPVRITISERNLLENYVEIKLRSKGEHATVPLDQVLPYVSACLK